MNYKKIYDALVEKAKARGLDKSQHEGYFEIHHIVPRCLGGTDEADNLVMLTGREHYVAHVLLWKLNPDNKDLFNAAWLMSNKSLSNRNRQSYIYAVMREHHSKLLSLRSEFNSPNYKDLVGLVKGWLTVKEFSGWTDQPKGKRTSTWLCECRCGESITLKAKELSQSSEYVSCGCYKRTLLGSLTGENNPFFGKTHSNESKLKMKSRAVGRPSNRKGVKLSEETKRKISESKKAKRKDAVGVQLAEVQ